MILHLCNDEKFIDYAISQFKEVDDANNQFIVIISQSDYEIKHIKQIDKVKILVDSEDNFKKVCGDLYKYDGIIFHSLFMYFYLKILHYADPEKINLVWLFWGGEFYNHYMVRNKYIGKLTAKKNHTNFQTLKCKIKKPVKHLLKKDVCDIENNIHKITHIVSFQEDYDIIRNNWKINAKMLWYSYYSIDTTISELINEKVNSDDIFVGNSASFTNNHLEVFKVLKRMDLYGRKIIVPLSYGNNEYALEIVKEGRKNWGDDFVPLLDFMDRNEYNKILLESGFVIMNHYRQQAVGNIITSLWLGAKVFLSERNPLYKFFRNKGTIIFSVEKDLAQKEGNAFEHLTDEQIDHNRKILYETWSYQSNLNNVREILKEISNK